MQAHICSCEIQRLLPTVSLVVSLASYGEWIYEYTVCIVTIHKYALKHVTQYTGWHKSHLILKATC